MDPLFLANSKLRLHKYDECIAICDKILRHQALDEAAWFLKTRAITLKDFIDDTDMEDESVAEILMDDNAMAKAPRPGTSLQRPGTSSQKAGVNQAIRPMSASGRPLTGFARVGTAKRSGDLEQTLSGPRPGTTTRPMSMAGRFVRLGTQSMLSGDDKFINPEKVDVEKFAKKRPGMAKALCDFLLYSEKHPRKAMELAAECTKVSGFNDWWWKARLGKAYYQLGMYRDAQKQFKSAVKQQDMIVTHLELCKIFIKIDQPNTALDGYMKAYEHHQGDTSILLGIARVYDMLNEMEKGHVYYKRVLEFDSANVEAIACIASHHFYSDHPELALRYYRRLVQIGLNNTELWNNVALCCFYSGQYDLTLGCFEKALALADDDNVADVWYNIGQMAIGIGDLNVAYQAFKVAVSVDAGHAESFNNLGMLDLRKPQPNVDQAKANFDISAKRGPHLFEPLFNSALLSFKLGDCEHSHATVREALAVFPAHEDSAELLRQLEQHFTML